MGIRKKDFKQPGINIYNNQWLSVNVDFIWLDMLNVSAFSKSRHCHQDKEQRKTVSF